MCLCSSRIPSPFVATKLYTWSIEGLMYAYKQKSTHFNRCIDWCIRGLYMVIDGEKMVSIYRVGTSIWEMQNRRHSRAMARASVGIMGTRSSSTLDGRCVTTCVHKKHQKEGRQETGGHKGKGEGNWELSASPMLSVGGGWILECCRGEGSLETNHATKKVRGVGPPW